MSSNRRCALLRGIKATLHRPWATLFALVLGAFSIGGCQKTPGEKWNVVVVTFDTTRADHFGCYGRDTIRTPTVDALAADGVLFERAYAHIPITLPSHSSLMTGKVPFAHGVRDNGIFSLASEQTTLAEILRDNGYRTAAAVGAFPLIGKFGLDQGFELYDDELNTRYEDFHGNRIVAKSSIFFDERRAQHVNEAMLPWIQEHHDQPFFAWIHYFDPHQPYEPPPPFQYEYARAPYEGEIAYADAMLGQVIARLRELGVYRRTIIVFTADHGEGLGEHNESTHSLLLYNSTLRVPLIIRVPDWEHDRVAERVGLVDVLPTILDLLELPIPEDIQGRSLATFLDPSRSSETLPPAPLYAETLSPRLAHEAAELRALYSGEYKYIHGPVPELYRLDTDDHELNDLVDSASVTAASMRSQLETYLVTHPAAKDSQIDLDEETAARLQALGYLHDEGGRAQIGTERLRAGGTRPHQVVTNINLVSYSKQLLFDRQPLRAKPVIDALIEHSPENLSYRQLRVQAFFQLNRASDARRELEVIVAQLSADDRSLSETLVLLAAAQRFEGDLTTALTTLQRALSAAPSASILYSMSSLHRDLGNTSRYREYLIKALEIDDGFFPALLDLAVANAEEGNTDQAREYFARALRQQPYNPRLRYNYGAFLLEQGRFEEAIAQLDQATQLQPEYAMAHHYRTKLLVALGREKDARASLDRFATFLPNDPLLDETRQLLEGATPLGVPPSAETEAAIP